MQFKLITHYLINPKRKTPSSGTFSLLNLSILFAAIIFLCPACHDAKQTLQEIVSIEETVEQLPLGEGLAIGATAPEFSLIDADGSMHSLSDYSGQKLVIVFYRMGTWGFCQTQLGELQAGYEDIKAQDAEIIAISADPLSFVNLTQQSLQLTYLLLSDENTEAIEAYNVIDTGNTRIARPATYIIDQDGRIAWKFLDVRFDARVSSDQILTELKKL